MDFAESEKKMLVLLLLRGDNSMSGLAELSGYSRTTVYRARDNLSDEGLIVEKSGGVWTLSDAGRRVAASIYKRDF